MSLWIKSNEDLSLQSNDEYHPIGNVIVDGIQKVCSSARIIVILVTANSLFLFITEGYEI